MNRFQLSCESTVDLPYSHLKQRDIPVLFYSYTVDGAEYPDDMGRDPEALPRFYEMLRAGKLPHTSQINQIRYYEYFESLLKKGDVLHLTFGSGMTPSVCNALAAAEELREKYPNRKLVIVDSTCSSSGYGMLLDDAADLRDNGSSIEETRDRLLSVRERIHHQFFSTDMKFFHRSGRVTGITAAVATVLGICPLMRLNREGKIVSYDKVRGKQAAIRATVEQMEQHAEGGKSYDGKLFLCHSDCPELAAETARAIEKSFPQLKGKIRICEIGTIIASHSGPGTVAIFFRGDERE